MPMPSRAPVTELYPGLLLEVSPSRLCAACFSPSGPPLTPRSPSGILSAPASVSQVDPSRKHSHFSQDPWGHPPLSTAVASSWLPPTLTFLPPLLLLPGVTPPPNKLPAPKFSSQTSPSQNPKPRQTARQNVHGGHFLPQIPILQTVLQLSFYRTLSFQNYCFLINRNELRQVPDHSQASFPHR